MSLADFLMALGKIIFNPCPDAIAASVLRENKVIPARLRQYIQILLFPALASVVEPLTTATVGGGGVMVEAYCDRIFYQVKISFPESF
jgi:hypothetical protein